MCAVALISDHFMRWLDRVSRAGTDSHDSRLLWVICKLASKAGFVQKPQRGALWGNGDPSRLQTELQSVMQRCR